MKHLRYLFLVVAVLAVGVAIAQAGTMTFSTADGPAVVPDNTGAATACQNITVAAAGPVIDDLNVSVASGHSWVGDLTLRLTAPNAEVLTLLNRPARVGAGAGNSDDLVASTPVIYDDAAASATSAEDMGDGCVGVIGVTAGCPDNYIPAPDAADTPLPGVGTNLAQYNGDNPNGVWQLCLGDSAAGDTGTLNSWSLTVSTTPVELESFSID